MWEDKTGNLEHFQKKIKLIKANTDLIVLPEMFTTGFSMNPEPFAEEMTGNTISWMKQMAKKTGSAIAGSIIVEEQGKFVNRFLFVEPNGGLNFYDKRHLFAMAGENKFYKQGTENAIIDFKGWKIMPQICYDLRFPVWSRNLDEYDLLIYVANWPEKRVAHWDALLKARAIENQSFVIGVNRIGKDNNGNQYSGNSAIYNPLGAKISNTKPHEDSVEGVTLNLELVKKTRNTLPFLSDKDDFTLKK